MTWEDIAPNSFYALMAGKPLAGKTPRNGFVFVLWRLQGDRDFSLKTMACRGSTLRSRARAAQLSNLTAV